MGYWQFFCQYPLMNYPRPELNEWFAKSKPNRKRYAGHHVSLPCGYCGFCALGMIALINEAKAQDTEGVCDLLMRIFGLDYNLLQNISYPWFLISLFSQLHIEFNLEALEMYCRNGSSSSVVPLNMNHETLNLTWGSYEAVHCPLCSNQLKN